MMDMITPGSINTGAGKNILVIAVSFRAYIKDSVKELSQSPGVRAISHGRIIFTF